MALPIKRFNGELCGKTIYDFKRELDYEIEDTEGRIELLKSVLEDDKGLPHDYFKEFFEPRVRDGVDISHFKVNPSKTEHLSNEMNVTQELDKMANYILHTVDNSKNKVKYNFYREDRLDKKMGRECSIDGMVDKSNDENADVGEVIDFLIRGDLNYKMERKQDIFAKDFEDEELKPLKDYQDAIEWAKAKIVELEESDGDKSMIYRLRKYITQCKKDQLLAKDMIKGTIYFKSPLNDEGESQLMDFFSFTNPDHVKALLKTPSSTIDNDLGVLVYDLENLIKDVDLDEREQGVLALYREDKRLEDIAKEFGVKEGSIRSLINTIVKKIIKKYKDNYTDWLYLNYKKGEYKKCSKCGEVKLLQMFSKNKSGKYGVRSDCKECESRGKKSKGKK